MGPITLFDKSFLQSLSLNEAVWFDHFFLTTICPVFYVETLADLGKSSKPKRSSEDEVRIIADKFPDMGGYPCASHADMVLSNLLGYEIPMTGQIPLDTGRLVSLNGKLGVISEGSPVSVAFSRWQDYDFDFVERQFARQWRNQLSKVNFKVMPEILSSWKSFNQPLKTLEQAKVLALSFIESTEKPFLRIEIYFELLQIPNNFKTHIRERWVSKGYPSIAVFAPYTAFVLSVIIYFLLAIRVGLISSNRVSTLTDIAYLFYLPFCMLFVSSDRLHRKVAPFFLRNDQEYVWGPDLKASLKEINLYYSLFPNDQKELGILSLAPTPPQHITTLVSALWSRHMRPRQIKKSVFPHDDAEKNFEEIKVKAEKMKTMPGLKVDPGSFRIDDIQSATITRKVRKIKGDWFQIPKKKLGD